MTARGAFEAGAAGPQGQNFAAEHASAVGTGSLRLDPDTERSRNAHTGPRSTRDGSAEGAVSSTVYHASSAQRVHASVLLSQRAQLVTAATEITLERAAATRQ